MMKFIEPCFILCIAIRFQNRIDFDAMNLFTPHRLSESNRSLTTCGIRGYFRQNFGIRMIYGVLLQQTRERSHHRVMNRA